MPTIKSAPGDSVRSRAAIVEFAGAATLRGYTAAVSLHAHTNRSREGMSIVPGYLERIPLIGSLVRRELRAYERRHHAPVDFGSGWWHPPVLPGDVLASEISQIANALGLQPFVSITDHDSVEAPLALRAAASADVLLSVEWTVPFDRGFLHLGIHNLPTDSGEDLFRALAAYTGDYDERRLPDLLDRIDRCPETLVVLNHPVWDLAGIGSMDHASLVRRFLIDHGDKVHAIEVNGYRSWSENTAAIRLAEAAGLPVVSGGDRHGRAPNALLNLTTSRSFGEFAREIREQRRSVVLVMPEYRQALVARKLAVAGDAVRAYPYHPSGQRHWTDRVQYARDGHTRQLSEHWPGGGPFWVRCATRLFAAATRGPLLHGTRLVVQLAGASMSDRPNAGAPMDVGPAATAGSPSSTPYQETAG